MISKVWNKREIEDWARGDRTIAELLRFALANGRTTSGERTLRPAFGFYVKHGEVGDEHQVVGCFEEGGEPAIRVYLNQCKKISPKAHDELREKLISIFGKQQIRPASKEPRIPVSAMASALNEFKRFIADFQRAIIP